MMGGVLRNDVMMGGVLRNDVMMGGVLRNDVMMGGVLVYSELVLTDLRNENVNINQPSTKCAKCSQTWIPCLVVCGM